MTKEICSWLKNSGYISPLSPGCKMCADGAKMVLLVTGLCPADCFYCPLSKRKQQKDVIFADEWQLKDENDTDVLLKEAELIEADGAGVTGGDPLIVWRRTKKYIVFLKNHFGEDFHIHLYTSGLKNFEHIPELISAGLDEIRFHPTPRQWSQMKDTKCGKTIEETVSLDVDVAVEIPSIPGMVEDIFSLMCWSDDVGVDWVNLNELEFSETNAERLKDNGFEIENHVSASVKGSEKSAWDVLNKAAKENFDVGVHYCSCSFKDGVQLTRRIKRRAENIAKEYEVVTDDGTLLKGVIYTGDVGIDKVYQFLIDEYDLNGKQVFLNQSQNRVEIAVWILEEIASVLKEKGCRCFMVEEYPTADHLEVERIPLPF